MVQGFDSEKPKENSPVASDEVRVNFLATQSNNSGGTAPKDAEEGWTWLDTSDPADIKFRVFVNGGWITLIDKVQLGTVPRVETKSFVFNQTISSALWTVPHNLNSRDLLITVYNQFGVVANTVVATTDSNTVVVTSPIAITGKVVILKV